MNTFRMILPLRCRFKRAYWILIVTFLIFVLFQLTVFQFQKPINLDRFSDNVKEGRRLFGGELKDEQVSGVFSHPANSRVLVSYVHKMINLPLIGDYNLTYPHIEDFSRGQCNIIDEFLNNKEKGFFIEIGAFDGEKHSVSLFFERNRHWDGLLVEPHPEHYKKLISKNRHSSSLQVCIKTNDTGSSKEYKTFEDQTVYVPCVWMETILLATQRKDIDLLAINVNSHEFDIVESIPFHRFSIKTLSIEFTKGSDSEMAILTYLQGKGYRAQHEFANHVVRKTDIVFVKL